jgi:hypothetical protein
MGEDLTAQGAVDQGRIAFRLTGATPLYSEPDKASADVETIAPGALIAVSRDDGPFLYVISPSEKFGYIADETPVTPLNWTPEAERRAAPGETLMQPAATAREVIDAALDPGTPSLDGGG